MPIPRTCGRYEVIDLIGQGGMGALFRAKDPIIGRFVAIKLLRSTYDSDEIRDRFAREARAAGCLNHTNIVTIYDVGEHDGLPFIAMEYVHGETFVDLIGLHPPLDLARKLQVIEDVCAGLAHAHDAGIVHRDIKPANLIRNADGAVKILDFGIAKLTASDMTAPGMVLGTLNYMAPEQVKGEKLDGRADIFAVGAVLYELLCQRPAFPGTQLQEVAQQILHQAPRPITDMCPGLDSRIVRVIDRALEKDTARRYQSASQMQRELSAIRLTLSPDASTQIAHSVSSSSPLAHPGGARRTPPALPAIRVGTAAANVDSSLAAAHEAFNRDQYDTALALCRQVLGLVPDDAQAVALTARIQARRDQQRIQQQLTEARRQMAAGAFSMALQVLEGAAVLAPQHPEIATLRDQVLAEQERARDVAVAAGLRRARAALTRGDAEGAIREAERLLALDPAHQDARTLKEEAEAAVLKARQDAWLRAAIDTTRRLFEKGDHQLALQKLEALGPAAHPPVAAALDEMRRGWEAIEAERRTERERQERRRRVAELVALAETALSNERFQDARHHLAAIASIEAAAPDVAALTGRIDQAETAARVRTELARLFGAFDDSLARGDLPTAEELLKAVPEHAMADPRTALARQHFQKAIDARAAKEEAEAREREGLHHLSDAGVCLESGDLDAAAARLKAAESLVPHHPRVSVVAKELKEALERRAAQRELERRRQSAAALVLTASERFPQANGTEELLAILRTLKDALELDPDSGDATTLKLTIEEALASRREAARIRAAIENARRRFENGKHQAAIQLLEGSAPQTHSEVAAALDEMRTALAKLEAERKAAEEQRQRERRVAVLFADARTALAQKQFDKALVMLANVAEIDPADASVAALTKEVRDAQAAAARRAQLVQRITEIEAACSRSDWETAALLVGAAAEAGFTDPSLDAFRQRISASRAKDASGAGDATITPGRIPGLALEESSAVPGAVTAAAPATSGLHRSSAVGPVAVAPAATKGDDANGRDSARIQAAIRNARTRAANGKYSAALKLLQDLDPNHPAVAEAITEIQASMVRLEDERRSIVAVATSLEDTGIHKQITLTEISKAASVDLPTAVFPALTQDSAAVASAPPISRPQPPPLPPPRPSNGPPKFTARVPADATIVMRAPQHQASSGQNGQLFWVLVAAAAMTVFLVLLVLLRHA